MASVIDRLKTRTNLKMYLKLLPVPRKKIEILSYKNQSDNSVRVKTVLCSQIHTNHKNALRRYKVEILNVQ